MRKTNGSSTPTWMRNGEWKKHLLPLSAAALLVPAIASAQRVGEHVQRHVGPEQRAKQQAEPIARDANPVLDVETLNDNPLRYAGQSITVAGEMEEVLGGHAFVLESGGLIDDEVAVIVPPKVRASVVGLPEDAELVVTGEVRAMRVVEIEREMGIELNPEVEVELEGVRHFLVAERVEVKAGR